jgi:hypothetical protein
MDPILQVLLSWQFVLFGLAVSAVLYVFRLIVEYFATVFKQDLSASKLWNNLILPIAPILFGVIAGLLLKKFPYPGFVADANGVILRGDRIIFGLVAGSLSTVMYRVIKSLLYQKLVSVAQGLNGTTAATTTAATIPTEEIPAEHLPDRGRV